MAHVLIIDDDQMIGETLSLRIMNLGHSAASAATLNEGLRKIQQEAFDLVFLDVRLPDGNGLDALAKIKEAPSSPEVIIITGVGDPDGAELAVKGGAWDYIQKPFSKQEIILQLSRALEYREKSRQKPPVLLKRDNIIGSSARLTAHLESLAQAANSNVNTLITGESGTGKELFARAIHENSARARKNFVVVDCAALPENLVENVLFGHKKGAFTGADKNEEGLVRHADGGTLFLDEVGELPLSIQKKFLRVLQEHKFRLVGSQQEISSDFRLIAATNRSLEHMAQAGQFRQDLLYRLRALTIELSPLRERRADIRELTLHHISRICARKGVEVKGFSPEFIEALEAYDWPGNVRELINTLERIIAAEPGTSILYPQHLSERIRIKIARTKLGPKVQQQEQKSFKPSETFPTLKEAREQTLSQIEKQYLQELMQAAEGDIQEICRISGLRRARLYELLKKYNISR